MGEFNSLPSRCEANCPVDVGDIARNGIVLTRNCRGPLPATQTADRSIKVEDGAITIIDEAPQYSHMGSYACRNTGFNEWLKAREQEFNERAGE